MHIHPKTALACACALTLAAVATSARADRVIDAFSNPFPQQTLPGTSSPAPLLWAGTINGVSQFQDDAFQSSLPGVIGGERYALVTASSITNLITATTSQAGGQYSIGYATGSGTSGSLLLEYGVQNDLNADLTADGSLAFELEIAGDMDNGRYPRPVTLIVEAVSGSGAGFGQTQVTLLADGVYQIPFANFPGVDFTDVDSMKFEFDASQVSAIDYELVGGLRTTNCLQASGSARADIFLDSFQTSLPQRYLPGYGMVPFMWVGTFNSTTKAIDTAVQSGTFGAIGGQRDTVLEVSDIINFITASMTSNNGTPELSYATGYPTSGSLTLEYGAQSDLNADLSQMSAFELELNGDLDSATPRPVPLTVTVASSAGSAATQVVLIDDDTYSIPFQSFPGVDFSNVDYIQFHFDATQVQAVDYTLIGGLRASACIP